MDQREVKPDVSDNDAEWYNALQTNPMHAKKIETRRKVAMIVFVVLFVVFAGAFLFGCLAFDMMTIYSNRGQVLLPEWYFFGVAILLFILCITAVFCSRVIGNLVVGFIVTAVFSGIYLTVLLNILGQLRDHIVDFGGFSHSTSQDYSITVPFFLCLIILSVLACFIAKYVKRRIKKPEIKYVPIES